MRIIVLLSFFFALISAAIAGEKEKSTLRGNGAGFIQNKGQIIDTDKHLRSDILFKGDGGGASVYLRKTGVSYVLNNMGEILKNVEEQLEELEKNKKFKESDEEKLKEELLSKQILKIHRLDVDFVNCNLNSETNTADQLEGYTNYYYSHCAYGITNVNSYNEITVKNVYNKIDVKYYGSKAQGLKYDIIVNTGADVRQLKLKYIGAKQLNIINEKLTIETELGVMGEYMPKVYQNIYGKIVNVKAKYILNSANGAAIVSFKFGLYNPAFPLIIDPWVTYYGGSSNEYGHAVAVDPSGNVVFTGYTTSTNFPTTVGAMKTAITGTSDAYVIKMNGNGVRLWATYIGGTGSEQGFGITTDASGNILATGYTGSTDFPAGLSGANNVHQSTGGGLADVFLIKFDPTGARLWATYYGGSNIDFGKDVATDSGSNVYLYGYTSSPNAISTATSFQSAFNTAQDAFIVQFNATGTRNWATYLGGSGTETCGGITCDPSGDIYVGGGTNSVDLPVSGSPYQVAYAGGNDAYLFKFSSLGALIWGTYYGGATIENGFSIACDGLGNVILGGTTASSTGIATAGTFQTTFMGLSDAFVAKFNTNGNRIWGTYIGGFYNDYCTGLSCDVNNNIVVAGDLYSDDLVVSSCAYQKSLFGNENQFIVTLDPNGVSLCSGYFGLGTFSSPHDETVAGAGGCIATDGCFFYLVGSSTCTYPVTAGAYQTTCGGLYDAALAKVYISSCGGTKSSIAFNGTPKSICVNNTINYSSTFTSCNSAGIQYLWTFSGGTPSTSTAINPTNILYSTPGTYDVKLIVELPCGKDTLVKTGYVTISPCGSMTVSATSTSVCSGSCAAVTSTPVGGTAPYTYSWSNGGNTQNINPCPVSPTTYTLTITDAGTTTATTTVSVSVNPIVNVAATATDITCFGNNNGSVTANSSSGTAPYTYTWSAAGGQTQTLNGLSAGSYTVTITDSKGCTSTSTIAITEPVAFTASATGVPAACGTSNGSVSVSVTGGLGPFNYNWLAGGATTQTVTGLSAGNYSVTVTDNNSCTATATGSVTNSNGVTATSILQSGISCNGGNDGSVLATITGGTAGYTYSWSNGTSGVTATGLNANTYTVTVTDGNNCQGTSSIVLPDPIAISTPTFITTAPSCGQSDGTATVTSTGGTGVLTFTWNNGGTGQTINNLDANIYTVTVIDSQGCTLTATTTLANIGGPSAISSVTTPIVCGGDAGSVNVSVSSGNGPYTYNWSNGSNSITSLTTQQLNNLLEGNYSVTIIDNNGCSTIAAVILTEPSPLLISTNTTDATCGNSTGSITATATGGSSFYTYSWSTGVNTVTSNSQDALWNLQPATYVITLIDNDGCTSSTSATISNASLGNLAISPSQQSITEGNSVTITVTGGTSYTWSPANSLTCTYCDNPIASPLNSTTYTITAIDTNGCAVIGLLTITVKPPCIGDESDVFIANVFSPNNDGKNDLLFIEGKSVTNIYWAIYDRWGNLLFEATDQVHGWDGTRKGNTMESGTYVYYLKATCIKTNTEIKLKGNVSLVR